jgi:hypothetical protein
MQQVEVEQDFLVIATISKLTTIKYQISNMISKILSDSKL